MDEASFLEVIVCPLEEWGRSTRGRSTRRGRRGRRGEVDEGGKGVLRSSREGGEAE